MLTTLLNIILMWFVVAIPLSMILGRMLANGIAQPQPQRVPVYARRQLPPLD